jgi:hypothetical protein
MDFVIGGCEVKDKRYSLEGFEPLKRGDAVAWDVVSISLRARHTTAPLQMVRGGEFCSNCCMKNLQLGELLGARKSKFRRIA